jgi:hypothetical protein
VLRGAVEHVYVCDLRRGENAPHAVSTYLQGNLKVCLPGAALAKVEPTPKRQATGAKVDTSLRLTNKAGKPQRPRSAEVGRG